jgi:hypothetical protein
MHLHTDDADYDSGHSPPLLLLPLSQVMVINFAVKESGLEAQLLSAVVKHERPELDRQRNDLVVKVRAGGVPCSTPRGNGSAGWNLVHCLPWHMNRSLLAAAPITRV